ncbi:MAG: CotH kinase family protein [Bdellovibrionales bacterium]|nr:CotH kinase family protein [Bdellovibrionales bacterium]
MLVSKPMKYPVTLALICAAILAVHIPKQIVPEKPNWNDPKPASDIPTIFVWTEKFERNFRTPGWIAVSSNLKSEQLAPSLIGVKSGGNTAHKYPKKRFHFQFGKESSWVKSLDRNLLGMASDDDWILDPAYRDGLLFRNQVNKIIYSKLEEPLLLGRLVDVVWNGEYQGVYYLTQRYERKNLGLKKTNSSSPLIDYFEDLSDESRLQFAKDTDRNIVRFLTWLKSVLSRSIELDEVYYKVRLLGADFSKKSERVFERRYPKVGEIPNVSNLSELLAWVNESKDEEFKSQIWEIFDQGRLLNYLCFLFLNSGADNVKGNYVLVKRNGKYEFLPWDLDNTFRSINYKNGKVQAVWDKWGFDSNVLFRRLLQLKGQDLRENWMKLRTDVFSEDEILKVLQSEFDQLNLSGAYDRNNKRWGLPLLPQSDELDLVKAWVKKRLSFVDKKVMEL